MESKTGMKESTNEIGNWSGGVIGGTLAGAADIYLSRKFGYALNTAPVVFSGCLLGRALGSLLSRKISDYVSNVRGKFDEVVSDLMQPRENESSLAPYLRSSIIKEINSTESDFIL